jgi:beta-xylosidase
MWKTPPLSSSLWLVLLLCACAPHPAPPGTRTYTNPVGEDLIVGDPFVLKHDGGYTLFGTTDPSLGFRCFHSPDLVNWEPRGFAWKKEGECWAGAPFWAPEVTFYRGRYYMTYSGRDRENGRLLTALAVSDHPEGPYHDLHAPWFDPGFSAIDAHIFVNADGRPYLYFSRNGMRDGYSYGMNYGAPLRPDLSGLVGEPKLLMEAEQEWERIDYARNRCNEGPFVLKHDGKYVMTYSANHTFRPGYGIGYATADDPLGPFTKSPDNPIAGSDPVVGYSGAGHSSITTSPDGTELFIVYHTHADPEHPENQQRTVNIDRLRFTGDGRLQILGPTRSPQPFPSGAD